MRRVSLNALQRYASWQFMVDGSPTNPAGEVEKENKNRVIACIAVNNNFFSLSLSFAIHIHPVCVYTHTHCALWTFEQPSASTWTSIAQQHSHTHREWMSCHRYTESSFNKAPYTYLSASELTLTSFLPIFMLTAAFSLFSNEIPGVKNSILVENIINKSED